MAQLAKGLSITLENGTLINPSDVQEEQFPSPIAMIIECPQEDLIDQITENKQFQQFYDKNIDKKEKLVNVIFHLSPK